MKYQLDTVLEPWLAIPREGVSIKILIPITILGWCQEGHPVINSIYEMTRSIDKRNCVNGIRIEDAAHSRTIVR